MLVSGLVAMGFVPIIATTTRLFGRCRWPGARSRGCRVECVHQGHLP